METNVLQLINGNKMPMIGLGTYSLPAYGNRPKDVSKFLTLSLEKLKLDYLDLYLIHHPFGFECKEDLKTIDRTPNNDVYLFDTDLEGIWRAMEKEVEAGRIKSLGLSNFNSKQIERIRKIAKYPPTVLQIEIHAYFQQRPLVEFCQKRGIVVVAYGPLGAPQYTQTQDGKSTLPPLLENPTVLNLSKRHGKSPGQILLRFLLQRNIIVIPKSVKPERINNNFKITDFVLSERRHGIIIQTGPAKGDEGIPLQRVLSRV
ncbi:Alcohol dehydrogenase [NADP(+)] A [Armadillidium vulgare]|nr:Alcohol dehydrogenase [NADP(+)] A [Armadillidium vulgare]